MVDCLSPNGRVPVTVKFNGKEVQQITQECWWGGGGGGTVAEW